MRKCPLTRSTIVVRTSPRTHSALSVPAGKDVHRTSTASDFRIAPSSDLTTRPTRQPREGVLSSLGLPTATGAVVIQGPPCLVVRLVRGSEQPANEGPR